ncbi:MAG: carboxypeptidase-like regulatory domain-containing protein [Bacteroidetes bacterium]|nr:carboxypeptidase-like regulatory domain-containing protein [Bacteroidota bacterium]
MKRFVCIVWCLQCWIRLDAQPEDVFNRIIRLNKQKGTVYELLMEVSRVSGFLFIYESTAVDNDKKASISSGTYLLSEAILRITEDTNLQMKLIGDHILLFKPPLEILLPLSDREDWLVGGYVRDGQTLEPLPFCSVLVEEGGIGTVANSEGRFVLHIPDSMAVTSIIFSQMGYRSKRLPIALFLQRTPDIFLEQNAINLQEIVVHYVPPQKLIKDMLETRTKNYAPFPAGLTSFYREGMMYEDDFVFMAEGVFSIYKTGLEDGRIDQVKLLKKRKITNMNFPDSVLIKIQAGVEASLQLDIVKFLPDFLNSDREALYQFSRVSMDMIDSTLVHVVAFEQLDAISEPLFKGKLYIAADSKALVKAEYEVNPRLIQGSGANYILKKSRFLEMQPQKIEYTVSYREWEGYYWISHVRGDLHFNVYNKRIMFGDIKLLTAYFEMVTCKIEKDDVQRFSHIERLPSGKIFSETRFEYDPHFWERFNIILPESNITETIAKLVLTVEEEKKE